jgi:lipid II:glycine glycyltransferase (peptidoglycan interpeptide bridge formation enzyme)
MLSRCQLDLLQTSRAYLKDIDGSIELAVNCIELEKQVKALKQQLRQSEDDVRRWKREYRNLSKSKMGKLQRGWWRTVGAMRGWFGEEGR